jgi:hypothetical protein
MVMFIAAVMIVGTSAATLNLLTQGRRDLEDEMIWRGQQYVRGVRLYYRKFGRFPQTVEDMVEPKTQVRFLRRPYTDPLNRADGSWRMIYVAPTGQLMNSLTRTGAIQFPQQQQQAGAGAPGKAPAPAAGVPPAKQQPTPPAAAPTSPQERVFGGNIIGVGSKAEGATLKVYNGATTYRLWEFIWDPTRDPAILLPGQPPGQPGVTPGRPTQRPTTPPRPGFRPND